MMALLIAVLAASVVILVLNKRTVDEITELKNTVLMAVGSLKIPDSRMKPSWKYHAYKDTRRGDDYLIAQLEVLEGEDKGHYESVIPWLDFIDAVNSGPDDLAIEMYDHQVSSKRLNLKITVNFIYSSYRKLADII